MTTTPSPTKRPFSLIPQAKLDMLCKLALAAPVGPFVEIGVYQGGSAYRLYEVAQEQGRMLWLYDTFRGIPDRHPLYDGHNKGDFADTSVEAVAALMPEAHIVPGVFPGSFVKVPGIAFVHADADHYRATRAICEVLPPLMVEGGMMLFDDYGQLGVDIALWETLDDYEFLPDGRALWTKK